MFVAGIDATSQMYFSSATLVIAIPTGIKVLNWVSTLWGGRIRLSVPLLFSFSFLFLFTFGGFTGIMLANVGFDVLFHDTYFVVGHFHYVLSLGAVFSIFSGFYYWWGKMTGYQYDEDLARAQFWLLFIGSNITFFPMHILGNRGMPRRIPDYSEIYHHWNFVCSYGSFISLMSILFWFYICYDSISNNIPDCGPQGLIYMSLRDILGAIYFYIFCLTFIYFVHIFMAFRNQIFTFKDFYSRFFYRHLVGRIYVVDGRSFKSDTLDWILSSPVELHSFEVPVKIVGGVLCLLFTEPKCSIQKFRRIYVGFSPFYSIYYRFKWIHHNTVLYSGKSHRMPLNTGSFMHSNVMGAQVGKGIKQHGKYIIHLIFDER